MFIITSLPCCVGVPRPPCRRCPCARPCAVKALDCNFATIRPDKSPLKFTARLVILRCVQPSLPLAIIINTKAFLCDRPAGPRGGVITAPLITYIDGKSAFRHLHDDGGSSRRVCALARHAVFRPCKSSQWPLRRGPVVLVFFVGFFFLLFCCFLFFFFVLFLFFFFFL